MHAFAGGALIGAVGGLAALFLMAPGHPPRNDPPAPGGAAGTSERGAPKLPPGRAQGPAATSPARPAIPAPEDATARRAADRSPPVAPIAGIGASLHAGAGSPLTGLGPSGKPLPAPLAPAPESGKAPRLPAAAIALPVQRGTTLFEQGVDLKRPVHMATPVSGTAAPSQPAGLEKRR
jgi:hypothetical protein